MLRGNCDFASVDEYRRFLQMLLLRLNAGRTQRLIEEMAVMRVLRSGASNRSGMNGCGSIPAA